VKTFAQLLPGHLALSDQDKLGDSTCDFTRDFARPSPDRGDEAIRHSKGWLRQSNASRVAYPNELGLHPASSWM
jgi:hypothetical protein